MKSSNETIFTRRYYSNGAHAGNISFYVKGWGPDSRSVEDEISQRLNDFISTLTVEHTTTIA
ncbi:hypothetical protein [Enterobacter hormaechei]|uniref:hypothetical protein n=1 Tax=Enterobacter hormaechei TaxID=158836 RepID=UPI00254D1DB8|nr:hypothetical protein [Enterobacter hormaechei]MDK9635049.1 hypothetical protein [Enterobacter hormaechei]